MSRIEGRVALVSGIKSIGDDSGGVDILINNAGYGSYGAVEDVPIDEARRQFDVNIFGLARLTQLVLPGMREKGYGKIVNISSMGGKIYTPFGACRDRANAVADSMDERYSGTGLSSPDLIGRVIRKSVTARRPRTRYASGFMAKPSLFLRTILSDRLFDRLIGSMM